MTAPDKSRLGLYALRLPDSIKPRTWQRLLAAVEPARRKRLEAFLNPAAARRSLLGELLARRVLADRCDCPPHALRFRRGPHGKPALASPHGPQFNIAHSGPWVVCAVSGETVGVDIEPVRPFNLAIARRFFAPEEYRGLLRRPEPERAAAFFRLWTLKESYLKAIGTGMTTPLRSFAFHFRNDTPRLFVGTRHAPDFHFKTYVFDRDYRVSVCARENAFPDAIRVLPMIAVVRKGDEK